MFEQPNSLTNWYRKQLFELEALTSNDWVRPQALSAMGGKKKKNGSSSHQKKAPSGSPRDSGDCNDVSSGGSGSSSLPTGANTPSRDPFDSPQPTPLQQAAQASSSAGGGAAAESLIGTSPTSEETNLGDNNGDRDDSASSLDAATDVPTPVDKERGYMVQRRDVSKGVYSNITIKELEWHLSSGGRSIGEGDTYCLLRLPLPGKPWTPTSISRLTKRDEESSPAAQLFALPPAMPPTTSPSVPGPHQPGGASTSDVSTSATVSPSYFDATRAGAPLPQRSSLTKSTPPVSPLVAQQQQELRKRTSAKEQTLARQLEELKLQLEEAQKDKKSLQLQVKDRDDRLAEVYQRTSPSGQLEIEKRVSAAIKSGIRTEKRQHAARTIARNPARQQGHTVFVLQVQLRRRYGLPTSQPRRTVRRLQAYRLSLSAVWFDYSHWK